MNENNTLPGPCGFPVRVKLFSAGSRFSRVVMLREAFRAHCVILEHQSGSLMKVFCFQKSIKMAKI